MKKHPILYIKSYGLKLWLIQIIILILNKFNILGNIKSKLSQTKNKKIYTMLNNKYQYLIDLYKTKKVKKVNSNKIWVLWWQGEDDMPEIVKKCVESIKKNLVGMDVIILSEKNFYDYVSLPEHIVNKYQNNIITKTSFSDIVRVYLLKNYGGMWFDSTIYVTSKLNKEELNKIKTVKFHCDDKTSISQGLWCSFLLGDINPKLFDFMFQFFSDYWKKEEIQIDYFLVDYIIKLAYDNFEEVKTDLDVNKENNKNIHGLCKMLNNKYNEKEYKKLLKENFLHKLSYKVNLQEFNDGKETYWYIIKNGGKNEK